MVSIFYHTFSEDDINNESLAQLKAILPEGIIEKASAFTQTIDQYRSLAGKALLAYAYEVVRSEELSWTDYEQEGLHKPRLKNGPFFNISHSGNVVVMVMSDHCDVGVDTEEIKPIEIENFQENFLPGEWTWLQNSANRLKYIRFYQLWTRKEAILKATGQGLSLPLDSFSVLNETVKVADEKWHLLNLSLEVGSATHIATARGIYDPADLRIEKCDLAKLVYVPVAEEV